MKLINSIYFVIFSFSVSVYAIEKIKYAGYTWRKDRYFFMCGGCLLDSGGQCTYTENCYMLDLAIGKKEALAHS